MGDETNEYPVQNLANARAWLARVPCLVIEIEGVVPLHESVPAAQAPSRLAKMKAARSPRIARGGKRHRAASGAPTAREAAHPQEPRSGGTECDRRPRTLSTRAIGGSASHPPPSAITASKRSGAAAMS